jgi:poly(3-hydroxyalkanoate) depolymerase
VATPLDGSPVVVRAGGLDLRVAVRPGDASRTPLLLMNGIGARLETFEPLLEHLDPSLGVIRFDAPGIGGSALPARPYRFRTLAGTLAALLDQLGVGEVDVLGISWGGALAQQFAFSQRRRCRRVVLVATGSGAVMVPGSPRVLGRMATPRRYRDREFMLEVAPEIYGGTARTSPRTMRELVDAFEGGGQRRAYALQLLAGVGWTSVGFLPLLTQPVLVLTGDDDPIIPVVNGRLLAALTRRSRLEIYHGGHIELAANPGLLAPSIERFLVAATAP